MSAVPAGEAGLPSGPLMHPGQVREAAGALARQVAAFLQACMSADRASAYTQAGRALEEALRHEFEGA